MLTTGSLSSAPSRRASRRLVGATFPARRANAQYPKGIARHRPFPRPVKPLRPSATRASPSVSALRVSNWRLERIRLNGSVLRGKRRASFSLFVCHFVLPNPPRTILRESRIEASISPGAPSISILAASILRGAPSLFPGAASIVPEAPSIFAGAASILRGITVLRNLEASILPPTPSISGGAASIYFGTVSLPATTASISPTADAPSRGEAASAQ